ncbi:MAG: ligase-associated DNA damage response endonuclease PdeM [Rhizobiaceae bacterium]
MTRSATAMAAVMQEVSSPLLLGDNAFLCDWSGCLYWPAQRLLCVSDLHLEKGSSMAGRGHLLPPYDTKATLQRLHDQIACWDPQVVVSLGDSFHDNAASARIPCEFLDFLQACMAKRDWIWIAGNHDREAPAIAGGSHCDTLSIGDVTFRHEPDPGQMGKEICGHLHPAARIVRRGRTVRRRCFASDRNRLIMPAFGAFTGGLNIRDEAFRGLFDEATLEARMIGNERIYCIAGKLLV